MSRAISFWKASCVNALCMVARAIECSWTDSVSSSSVYRPSFTNNSSTSRTTFRFGKVTQWADVTIALGEIIVPPQTYSRFGFR
uniref:Putative secreted protein n=1 Tax=Anopheles darlingi TaxID=43151 RepID=A0A2M4D6I8_ANODA